MKIQKWLELKENRSVLIIIVMTVLFCLRFINLDSDLPNWDIAEYTPLDEGHYAMQAFDNLDQETAKSVDDLTLGDYRRWNSSVSFLNTVFCTITLRIFGNNYYGLRSSSVFAALIVFILILLIAKKEQSKEKNTTLLVLGLLMLFDFAFLLAGRIVEPSIYRMLIIIVMVYVYWMGCKKGNANYFLLGIFSVLSFVWGYITNVFVLIPCGILILLETFFWKTSFWKTVIKFISGMCCGYIIGEILYFWVQDRFFFQDIKRVVFEREIQRVVISIDSMINNFKSFLQGNMFSYNSLFLVIAVIAVLFLVIPNLIMNYVYVVDMSKTQKQMMMELQNLVGEQYVLGIPHAYRLYNEMIPASSGYDYYYEDDYFGRACELVKREDVYVYEKVKTVIEN